MALQGDLQSFALPDVLRLLAGTGKTGRLAVESGAGSGDVWLKAGQVVGAGVTSSPYAQSAADVVFELLRFDGGSFNFEDDAEPDVPGEPADVEAAIGQAEGLLDEWKTVEAVVPSVHSWVSLRAELNGEQTTVTADQWRSLAALGGGSSVRDLGNRFSLTDLGASRTVKDLVESGLVELGDPRDPSEASTPAVAAPPPAPSDDLAVLRADDGPVVLESRDDALLPEPLPSESTSFEGELTDLSGSVDGRTNESAEDAEATADPEVTEAAPPVAASGDAMHGADEAEEQAWNTFASGDTMVDHLDDGAEATEAGPAGSDAGSDEVPAAPGGDSDRGSLLKFLSTVKN